MANKQFFTKIWYEECEHVNETILKWLLHNSLSMHDQFVFFFFFYVLIYIYLYMYITIISVALLKETCSSMLLNKYYRQIMINAVPLELFVIAGSWKKGSGRKERKKEKIICTKTIQGRVGSHESIICQ